MSKGKFEINPAGIAKLQRDLEKKFSGGVNVPLSGNEADAIRDVKKQLTDLGVEPNDTEVCRMVHETRGK